MVAMTPFRHLRVTKCSRLRGFAEELDLTSVDLVSCPRHPTVKLATAPDPTKALPRNADQNVIVPGGPPASRAEVYGSDVLDVTGGGPRPTRCGHIDASGERAAAVRNAVGGSVGTRRSRVRP